MNSPVGHNQSISEHNASCGAVSVMSKNLFCHSVDGKKIKKNNMSKI